MKHNKEKKVGIALGGGGARGLAHIGVIKALEEAGIPIHYIAGTSMGALVGGWYALSEDFEFIEDLFSSITREDVRHIEQSLDPQKGGLFNNDDIASLLEVGFSGKDIEICQIPFAAVATDIQNGDQVVIDSGPLDVAIRASTAVPMVFPPVEYKKRLLTDGGLVNPVPADVVKSMGADVVIAVDVSSKWVDIREYSIDTHDMYHIFSDAMSVVEYQVGKSIIEKNADILIRPSVVNYSWLDFHEHKDIIEKGYRATMYAMKDIEKATGYTAKQSKDLVDKFVDLVLDGEPHQSHHKKNK